MWHEMRGSLKAVGIAEERMCPRQDSNLRLCLRRAPLYPLSYGGPGAMTLANRERAPADPGPLLATGSIARAESTRDRRTEVVYAVPRLGA